MAQTEDAVRASVAPEIRVKQSRIGIFQPVALELAKCFSCY